MLVLSRGQVAAVLTMRDVIAAVEGAFAAHARGSLPDVPGVLATHVPGGGFHVKVAALGPGAGVYAAKINANFPANPVQHQLPTIQGLVALFETGSGRPLALLDSMEITTLRTAAATALAARYLACAQAHTLTIVGCGVQGRAHLRALAEVRPIRTAWLHDVRPGTAERLAEELGPELAMELRPTRDLAAAVAQSEICVTCTSSRQPVLGPDDLHPGLFIAAVGADNPEKQELDPRLLARSRVVADLAEQAATIGELHHALRAGLMARTDVHAELGEVIVGARPGRTSEAESFAFDSTGTALQDVATAALAWERAKRAGSGLEVMLEA